jgi:hypothetical protein
LFAVSHALQSAPAQPALHAHTMFLFPSTLAVPWLLQCVALLGCTHAPLYHP